MKTAFSHFHFSSKCIDLVIYMIVVTFDLSGVLCWRGFEISVTDE